MHSALDPAYNQINSALCQAESICSAPNRGGKGGHLSAMICIEFAPPIRKSPKCLY